VNRRGRSAIGLDIGTRRVKAAQVARVGNSTRVVACADFERIEPGAPISAREMDRAAGVLERKGFEGRECVVSMDRALLLTSELELPPLGSGAPREQIARLELARAHRREPDGFEVALWEVPGPVRSGPGAHALVTACPHDRAEALLDAAEGGGLDIAAIDHPGCALARLMRVADARTRAVLDLGWSAAVLVLVRAGTVLYERAIDGGSIRALSERMSEQTGLNAGALDVLMSDVSWETSSSARRGRQVADRASRCVSEFAEAVGRELKLSIEYLARRFPADAGDAPVEHIDLAGGGAGLSGVVARLTEKSGFAMPALRPADVLGAQEALLRAASAPALSVAAGLALWAGEAEA